MSPTTLAQAFVGRHTELSSLHARLNRALAGQGGLVAVTGEPGAGKSSLVDRFVREAVLARPELRVINTYCSEQYGADEPYQPFLNAFSDLVADGQKPRGMRELAREVAPHWLQAVPIAGDLMAAAVATAVELRRKRKNGNGESGQSLRDLAAELAPHWLGAIPVAGDLIAAAHSTALELKETLAHTDTSSNPVSEEALFYQYTELFLSAVKRAPILLVIEDVHWADRASVALLNHLTRQIAAEPALLLITYRPADVERQQHPILPAKNALESSQLAEEVTVGTFGTSDIGDLLREQLAADVDLELVQWLQQRSNGNPLFLTELMRWLVESGYACEKHGEWRLMRRPADVEIPRSAESVIEKRLARLAPEPFRVLEYASVEGDQFHLATLARLLEQEPESLRAQLDQLADEHQLLRPLGLRDLPNAGSTMLYTFSHTIVQDVLHANLHPRRRILLHRRLASVLEDVYGPESAAAAPKLAIHCHEGRMRAAAYHFSVMAAESATRLFAIADALDLLQRALSNARNVEQRVEVLARMGSGYRSIGRFAEALAAFEEALPNAQPARARDIRRELVYVHRDHGSRTPELLVHDLEELEFDLRRCTVGPELCRVLWAYRLFATGPEQVQRAREAVQIAELSGAPEVIAKAHFELGGLLMLDDTPEQAFPHLRKALDLYTSADDLLQAAQCHNFLAVAHVFVGKVKRAAAQFEQAAALFERVHSPTNLAAVLNNMGVLLLQTGEFERAEHVLKEALRVSQRLDAAARALHPLENLARLHQSKADWERAREEWNNLLRRARELSYWSPEAIALCGLGTVALEQGHLAEGRVLLRDAELLLAKGQGWSEARVQWQMLAARIATAEGQAKRAVELLLEAEAALPRRYAFRWGTLRYYRAVALAQFDPEAAAALVHDCINVFNRIDAQPMRAAAQQLLIKVGRPA